MRGSLRCIHIPSHRNRMSEWGAGDPERPSDGSSAEKTSAVHVMGEKGSMSGPPSKGRNYSTSLPGLLVHGSEISLKKRSGLHRQVLGSRPPVRRPVAFGLPVQNLLHCLHFCPSNAPPSPATRKELKMSSLPSPWKVTVLPAGTSTPSQTRGEVTFA